MLKISMNFLINMILITCYLSLVFGSKMVCHYDTSSANRVGPLKFTSRDLEKALQFCTHIIYGYVSIAPKTFEVTTLTAQREQELANMIYFKNKYPNVKFLLSISGDDNYKSTKNFLHLLEAGHQLQQAFVQSTMKIVHKYKFDGLSLDFPFPKVPPIAVLSKYDKLWKGWKKLFYQNSETESKVEHRAQFTDLVQQLSTNLKRDHLMLTLTVLPNTNSKLYFDVPSFVEDMDFIILSAFDFNTPERNPKVADYMAPIKPLEPKKQRSQTSNIKYLAKQWHHQQVPRNKIVIGVATWGRSWKMTKESTNSGIPPIFFTGGPAPAGPLTHTAGFMAWTEICQLLKPSLYESKGGESVPLQRVVDPKMKKGNYAFRPADKSGKHGIWISYEDPATAGTKADYVRNHNLGGVALFDLSLDDFAGYCTGDKFPILRTIKVHL